MKARKFWPQVAHPRAFLCFNGAAPMKARKCARA